MKALASSLGAWQSLERQEGTKGRHGLTFPLAVVEAIGAPHGLVLTAEEHAVSLDGFDAVFVGVLDVRNLLSLGAAFSRWKLPLRSSDRSGSFPLVWMGGGGTYNAAPLTHVADLIVLGDAEPSLPTLLDMWHSLGNSARFLAAAAQVPGVFVPSVHGDTPEKLVRSVADDISVTLDNDISIGLGKHRRLEIARGCKFACRFCTLGWAAPLRENSASDVIAAMRASPRTVHLQAGDAESHTGIAEIRAALSELGGHDTGWTGRVDTTTSDEVVPARKRYAFGVEGLTSEVRALVGKAFLTDERLVADTVSFMSRIEGGSKGRCAWHLIAGLPGERPADTLMFAEVLHAIDAAMTEERNLSLHWQPFQPAPGTPMAWFPAGSGARRLSQQIDLGYRGRRLHVRHFNGRTDDVAAVCTALARSGPDAVRLFEAQVAGQRVEPSDAAALTGSTWGDLVPDAGSSPWWRFESDEHIAATVRHYEAMKARVERMEQDHGG